MKQNYTHRKYKRQTDLANKTNYALVWYAFTTSGQKPYNPGAHTGQTILPFSGGKSPIRHTNTFFCSCDLDLDPMTLIHKTDLDIL